MFRVPIILTQNPYLVPSWIAIMSTPHWDRYAVRMLPAPFHAPNASEHFDERSHANMARFGYPQEWMFSFTILTKHLIMPGEFWPTYDLFGYSAQDCKDDPKDQACSMEVGPLLRNCPAGLCSTNISTF